jgi:hypothetical protein
VQRRGRHNHYTVNEDMPLRRPAHAQLHVGDLLGALVIVMGSEEEAGRRRRPSSATGRRLPKTE